MLSHSEVMQKFEESKVKGSLYGVPIPDNVWVGKGAYDEFDNGKGNDDDCEQTSEG